MLVSHWSYQAGTGVLYMRLHQDARWSDGLPVSTADIRYSLQFLIDPVHQTDWQRQRITARLKQVEIFDARHFAFHLREPFAPAMEEMVNFRPLAAHFYADMSWPEDMNWQPEPVTGPHQIIQIKHNQSLTLQRDNNWWARYQPFFTNRFNVRRVTLRYMASGTQAWTEFRHGELDAIPLNNEDISKSAVLSVRKNLRTALLQDNNATRQEILLLNPEHPPLASRAERLRILSRQTFIADSGPRPEVAVLQGYPLPEWLKSFPTQEYSAGSLLHAVRTGQFGMLWAAFDPAPSASQLQALLPHWVDKYGPAEQWHQQGLLRTSSTASARYSLFWEWLELPGDNLPRSNPLEPFNPVTGGYFWINRGYRTDIMANPARPAGEAVRTLMIDRNGHATWQSLQ